MNICMVGEGAISSIHMDSLRGIGGATVTCLVGGVPADAAAFAAKWQIPTVVGTLGEALARPDVDAVILGSPSHMHADQAEAVVAAGRHVLVEIPMGMSLREAQRVAALERPGGQVVMVAHTRRFSPAHRHLRGLMRAGELQLQHLVCETLFFRRTNTNMLGKPRSWVDSLLWHHACHTIDLAVWLTGEPEMAVIAQQGPDHPGLGIPMDMTIGLKAPSGTLLSLVLSFNNKGPFGGFYRYICDRDTFHVFRDELKDADGNIVALEGSGFVDQDRAFVAACRDGADHGCGAASCLPAMALIDRVARCLDAR